MKIKILKFYQEKIAGQSLSRLVGGLSRSIGATGNNVGLLAMLHANNGVRRNSPLSIGMSNICHECPH